VPLVIITRPWHANDSLSELAAMGARIITNADRNKSLTYLKHARCAAMAFETDSLPGAFTTIIHAMFMGVPCVATACLGMDEYILNGQTGFVVPFGEQEALTQALATLWRSPQTAAQFGAAAHQRAQQLHSLVAAAERFEHLCIQTVAY
jgi:glycosyltransferase involved in cell wall biosynthesis